MYEEIWPLQKKEYQILKELKRVCEKNRIEYSLAFGTMIGAIRHEGFIPWDDDIDVTMNYPDYMKFQEACKRDLEKDYFLQTIDNDPESGITYLKLRLNSSTLILDTTVDKDMHQGINIDIYPNYHVPDSLIMRKLQLVACAFYMLFCEQKAPENHGVLFAVISKIVLSLIRGNGRIRIRNACHKMMARYEGKKTKYMAQFYGNLDRCKRIYPSEYFESGFVYKRFVDEFFPVQSSYDLYLKQRYGDYMKMPPKEQQGVKLDHIVKIDTNKSYLEYKGILYCVESREIGR